MELDICLREFLNLDVFPTDLDEKFISSFTELCLPIGCCKTLFCFKLLQYLKISGEEGLRKLEAYCHGPARNTEILLAFYIEILQNMIKQCGGRALESSNTLDFLSENESLLMHTKSSTLKQLVFKLLVDIESIDAIHPFKFDIDSEIHEVLSADQTSVYVRRAVENLAIVRLKKLICHKSCSTFLMCNLVESVLESDYLFVLDSVSRVLLNFTEDIADGECQRLVHKAKNSKKIGLLFARLIATILLKKEFGSISIISAGFCNPQTHVTILSELVECNRNAKKFPEVELLDLLVVTAGERFNFIAPHLETLKFSSKQKAREFAKTLIHSLGNPRLCSHRSFGFFSKFLLENDDEMLLYPAIFDEIKYRILESPNLLKFFADQNDVVSVKSVTFNRVFQVDSFRQFLSDAVKHVLINQSETIGWEEKDSALELLQLCGSHLDLDFDTLQQKVLRLAKSDESEFVRSSATTFLIQVLTDKPSNVSETLKIEIDQLRIREGEANQPAGEPKRDMKAEIEDIIKTMRNSCGLDECVTKECF